jgi:hypothetical protein
MECFARTKGTNVQPKKEWVAPKMKKISIEQITAAGPTSGADVASRS